MKRILVALSLLLTLWTADSAAQGYHSKILSGTTCPGAGCLNIDVGGAGSIGIQITGTFSGTLQFEQTIDASTFATWSVTPNGLTTTVTSTTASGLWVGPTNGMRQVRVRFSAYTSGTAIVTTVSSSARGGGGGSGGAGGGSNNTWTGTNRFEGNSLWSNIASQAIGTVTWTSSVGEVTSTAKNIFAVEDSSTTTRFDGVHTKLLLTPTGAVSGEKVASTNNIQIDSAQNVSSTIQASRNSASKTGTGTVAFLRGERTDLLISNGNVTNAEAGYFQALTTEGADTVTSMHAVTGLSQLGGSSPVIATLRGALFTAQIGVGSSADVPTVIGGQHQAYNVSVSGDITDLIGTYSTAVNNSISGTVTNMIGNYVRLSGTGPVPTNVYGYYVATGLPGTAASWSFYNDDPEAPMFSALYELDPLTFATLPAAPRAGFIAYITDSNSVVWGATAAGGGTDKVMVFYNGTNWTVFAK